MQCSSSPCIPMHYLYSHFCRKFSKVQCTLFKRAEKVCETAQAVACKAEYKSKQCCSYL